MNDEQKTNMLRDSVLEKIRSNEVKMRSKTYFILKIFLLAVIVIATLVGSSLLMSFIFFSIKVSGKMSLLGFGGRGITMFILLFPWKILIFVIALLFLLEWLLKKFAFGYRNPFVYLLSGVALMSMLFGFFINFTPLHRILLRETEGKRPPPIVGGFYRNVRRPSEARDVFRATIQFIEPGILTVENIDSEKNEENRVRKIMIPQGIPRYFQVGDKIFVAGEKIGSEFRVFGIRKFVEEIEE